MRVICRGAPALFRIGHVEKTGTLTAATLPALGYTFQVDGSDLPLEISSLQWQFEALATGLPPENATQPSAADPIIEAAREITQPPIGRRSREQYDAQHFAADVDWAIERVLQTANQQYSTLTLQPNIQTGQSRERSTFEVCATIVLRSLGGHFGGTLGQMLKKARNMLIEKNAAYGNSALDPVRVFSQASLKEQLLVRLDDKVSRLARGSAAGEDVVNDMLGYLILVEIAEKRERENA